MKTHQMECELPTISTKCWHKLKIKLNILNDTYNFQSDNGLSFSKINSRIRLILIPLEFCFMDGNIKRIIISWI